MGPCQGVPSELLMVLYLLNMWAQLACTFMPQHTGICLQISAGPGSFRPSCVFIFRALPWEALTAAAQ